MRRALAALALCVSWSLSANAATFTVNDLGDASDTVLDGICSTPGNGCTLRAAIEEANATAGADTIDFSVAGTISPATAYPSIIETLEITGATAPGYVSAPVVIIDGAFSIAIGLHFDSGADDSMLDAVTVYGFSDAGVRIDANTVGIRRNYIGPAAGGTPNGDGLQLAGNDCTVGGEDGLGNVISGNFGSGILLTGSNNTISDNRIGTDPAGTNWVPNEDGIYIDGTAANNTIGGTTDGDINLISGNNDAGVEIAGGTGNVIAGNCIGTNAACNDGISNFTGVVVGAPGNFIGTATTGNVISGNEEDGIDVLADDTVIHNNIVGLDGAGSVAIPNGGTGIFVVNSLGVDIGGSGTNEGNVVSGNAYEGIFVAESEDVHVVGNIVGLDASGANAAGNEAEGIVLAATFDCTIVANVVSANASTGIVDAGGEATLIESNFVGTTADDSAPMGNGDTGIEIFGSNETIVRSNRARANAGHGIEVTFGSIGVQVYGNEAGGTIPGMGNYVDGINVCDSAEDTIVGSETLGGNIMTGNLEYGLGVEPTALTNNTWAANSIYDNGLLGIDIGIDGVTPNDEDDPDTGANNLQNFPELVSANTTPAASQVTGTLNTLPSTPFTIHFYSSPAADPSGFGEGQTYLGAVSGTTDAGGDAAFAFTGPALTAGHVITATATTSDGTSEFSGALAVQVAPQVAFSSATYSIGEAGVSVMITVTRTGDLSGPSSVDYQTSDNTATAGADYTAASGTLTFAPGDASETFTIVVANDTTDEPHEIVNLTLLNPGAATLGAQSTAQLTITDDDDPPSISIGDVSRSEGTSPFEFEVTLSAASGFTVTVDYATANGTAGASDYTAIGTTKLTFNPGVTSQTVSVNVTDDNLVEGDETFFVNLSNVTNAAAGDTQGLGTIENDDAATLTIDDVALAEGDSGSTNFVFTVTSSATSTSNITINYSTANGDATAGTDYTAQSGIATITSGTTSTTITVPVTGETLVEGDETFVVNLTGAAGAAITDNQGLGTIENDDAVTLTIDDVSLAEGDSGNTNFVFTVTSSAPSASDITINYSTANGGATAGSDYTGQSGIATITAGTISTTITVPVTGETLVEGDETFVVNLTGAAGASIIDNQALGTIENDDVATLTIDDVALAEGDSGSTNFVFTLTIDNISATDITINYSTADGGATAGTDYTAQSGTATITAGTTSTTITVPVTGDTTAEPDETFFVNLTGATGASIGDNQGLGTIQNEGLPSITIGDVSLEEGNSGTTSFVFNVTLSGTSASDVTVNYATAAGTATSGSDYTAQSGTATITAGTLSTTITVPVIGELLHETDETFFVNLSGPTNAAISDAQALGTIDNDDVPPAIVIDDNGQLEGNSGTAPLAFTISLNAVSGIDVTVNYTTVDGTADAGSDYVALSGTATIPAGSTSTIIPVIINGDTLPESDETFFVNLSGAMNATIADNQGIGTIVNDDGQPVITIDDVSIDEGNAGNTPFVFTLTLNEVSGDDVTVNFSTTGGTATSGVDFLPQINTAVIPAGSTSTTIPIQVVGDLIVEADETFFVNLHDPINATIGDAQAQGTILNDDAGADLSITKSTPSSTFVPGQQVTYTITVTNGGPVGATGITVTDALPAGTTFVSASGTAGATCSGTTIVVCTIPTLAGDASSTITLVVTATGNAPIANTATVQAVSPSDPAAGNNSAAVTINPAAATRGAAIPTASEWGLMLLTLALAVLALRRMGA